MSLPSELEKYRVVGEHPAGEILGLSVKTLRNRRHRGLPPVYFKIGKAVRYRVSDLLALMDESKVPPKGE
jgi:hypothetical protein